MEHGLYRDENGELQCEDHCIEIDRPGKWLLIIGAAVLAFVGIVSLF